MARPSSALSIIESYEAERFLVVEPCDVFARAFGAEGARPVARGAIRLLVTGREEEGATRRVEPPLDLMALRSPSGTLISRGYAESKDSPHRLEGRFRIRIESDLYQPLDLDRVVRLPEPEEPIFAGLEPSFGYPFPPPRAQDGDPILVRGEVLTSGGAGIAGVRVTAEPPRGVPAEDFANTYRTEANGRWVLWLKPSERLFPKGPNGTPAMEATIQVVLERPEEAPVKVPVTVRRDRVNALPQTAIRGRVVGKADRPVAGAIVRISNVDMDVTSDTRGRWVHYYPAAKINKRSSAKVSAKHPDGRASPKKSISIEPGETAVAPDLRIE